MTQFDVAIIGAGIAGASAAYEIAATHSVLLLEAEGQPGYHTSGRSAALFTETYGNATIQGLTTGSRAFYEAPPAGFTDHLMLSPRGVVYVARPDQVARLEAHVARVAVLAPATAMLTAEELLRRVPILRRDYVAAGATEPDAMDIDVAALHQGYLRGARQRGVTLVCDAGLTALARAGGVWRLRAGGAEWTAGIVVNASGAWADVVAAMAGAAPVGLVPKRRTAMMLDPPPGVATAGWPMVTDADETFYFKPDAGRLLASPADETPMHPHDVQPDELDIAICIDRVQQAAELPVRRVVRSWAGLRSFVADKTPVVGFDPAVPGFFWLVGQGGYGFQTAPAMSRLAAGLLRGGDVPEDLAARGVRAENLAPGRPGLAVKVSEAA
jgi:D-arginine dehydrogenase